MRVWQLTPDMAEAWREIRLEALRTSPDSYGTRLDQWQHRPLADFAARLARVPTYAAGHDLDRPLAIAAWEPDHRAPARAWAISVYARPEARGHGYAAAVMDRVSDAARQAGYRQIGLSVGVHNIAARKLYARLGYIETDRPPAPNDNGILELDMVRPL